MTGPTPGFTALQDIVGSGKFSKLSDEDTSVLIYRAFTTEIDRLKAVPNAVETGERASVVFPSQWVAGGYFDEVDRTLVGILALRWILAGDYESFTGNQNDRLKLSRESFADLRGFFKTHLESPADTFALLVATVVNDLGKDPNLAIDCAKATGFNTEGLNHDAVLYEAARGGMIPCIQWLEEGQRRDVMLGLELGAQLNFAQVAQAENVPGSLISLKIMEKNKKALPLKYMEQYLDLAGANGHMDSSCAKAMIEPVFQGYYKLYDALLGITAGDLSLREGYDKVLTNRDAMLQKKGFRRLDVTNRSERALLRLLLMGRADSKETAESFASAYKSLPDKEKKDLVDGLNVDGYNDGKAILPYYMPALFAEGLRNPRKGKVEALGALMRFLARVVSGTKSKPGSPGEVVEKDLLFAKKVIGGEDFENDPTVLDKVVIPS